MHAESYAEKLVQSHSSRLSPFSMQLLYGESHLDIWWNQEKGWMYLDWKGQQTQESVRQGAERLLELMVEYGVYSVLNDNSNTTGSWLSSLPWVIFNFLPRLKKAGMQRSAHVYGRDKLTRLSAEAAKLLFDPATANIRMFNHMLEAETWLESEKAAYHV